MEEKDKVVQVPVDDILPNRFQPRLAFDEKELTELSNSILRYGVIQPIVLRKIGNKYEIIAGERRYKASLMAGLKTIPAIINNTDDDTSAEIALLENLQRKNLTVIEEAKSFKKLIDRGFTQEEIANKLSISQSSIANKIRLLNLPKRVQDALLFNKISERHARSLLSLSDVNMQLVLLDRIINEKLTVRQTEDEINNLLNKNNNTTGNKEEIKDNQENQDNHEDYINKFIPDVVSIEDDINPFQVRLEDNIRKIEERNNNESLELNDVSIKEEAKNHIIFEDEEDDNNEDSGSNVSINTNNNEKLSIINVVNKVRNAVNEFNDKRITTKEEDFPDKYRIIIEVEKNVE